MSSFKIELEELIRDGKVSFKAIRDIAKKLHFSLPRDVQNAVYEALERGKHIIDDDYENACNCYLMSFGNMHEAKLLDAFDCLPADFFNQDIEILDWGCGQALATVCYLDFLKTKGIHQRIHNITLIEPSLHAAIRGEEMIHAYNMGANVQKVVKKFDELLADDIISNEKAIKLHLFSNILDVATFDMSEFANKFQDTQKGVNYFVCVGPCYPNTLQRTQEFMTAVGSDVVYGVSDDPAWKNDWTRSMRVFMTDIRFSEEVSVIRDRIAKAQRNAQYHAGFIIDPVSDALSSSPFKDKAEELLRHLCDFTVRSNKNLHVSHDINSRWAVINNLVTRGVPTRASLFIEEKIGELLSISKKDADDNVIHFSSEEGVDGTEIFYALHTIDPRFHVQKDYNTDILESSFEKRFLKEYLSAHGNEHLAQVLEPQRPLSSLISIPDKQFASDQRVDFALEVPYHADDDPADSLGFIVEIDGKPFHSGMYNRIADQIRDKDASDSNWKTYRLEDIHDDNFAYNWDRNSSFKEYLNILKWNFTKSIDKDWGNTMQVTLSPLAAARIEKVIIEAIMLGYLDLGARCWKIAVIERDVPGAALAIEDLKLVYEHICGLEGVSDQLPEIKLDIVSTREFVDSPLHLEYNVSTQQNKDIQYDICIDSSVLLRDNIDNYSILCDADTYFVCRTSHYEASSRTIYTASPIRYAPLVEKDRTGNYVSIPTQEAHLRFFLQNIFRKRDFRQGQLPIMSRALSGQTTIGLLPTGGGKSLTYQLSSVLQPGVTVIVDPLVSLMVDQFEGLRLNRIDTCACLYSRQNGKTKGDIAGKMSYGCYMFVFMSPERFMVQSFRRRLREMSEDNHVYFSYGVIDEVHCVSEWGHEFRTAYLHLGRNMYTFMRTKDDEPAPIMGLTATASFDVLADVERELTVPGKMTISGDSIVRPEEDDRPELTYEVIKVNADFSDLNRNNNLWRGTNNEWAIKDCVSQAKKQKALELIDNLPHTLCDLNCKKPPEHPRYDTTLYNLDVDSFYYGDENDEYQNAGIIFCPHKKGIFGVKDGDYNDGIATSISKSKQSLVVSSFTSGDKPEKDMAYFIQNKSNLMVATKAFGMGIDKPNVRFTIDFSHPSSVEGFVQEAGRAGRDRKNAIGYVLYEPSKYVYISDNVAYQLRAFVPHADYQTIWNNRGYFIIYDDIENWGASIGLTANTIKRLPELLEPYSNNIDKDIQLFFHNSSFKGAEKEKRIMYEFTDDLLNVKPTNCNKIQEELQKAINNDDIRIKVDPNYNAVIIVSNEQTKKNQDGKEFKKQYAFIKLSDLSPRFNFNDFPRQLSETISDEFVKIFVARSGGALPNDRMAWLNQPLPDAPRSEGGILAALESASIGSSIFLTISWENSISQDPIEFLSIINEALAKIIYANYSEFSYIIQNTGLDLNLVIKRYVQQLPLNPFNFYDKDGELIEYKKFLRLIDIAMYGAIGNGKNAIPKQTWWSLYGLESKCKELRKAYHRHRSKSDTEKAIYRMCCIGLIDDVTIDYPSETYQIKIIKKTEGEYYRGLQQFLERYYTPSKAKKLIEDVPHRKGRGEIDKCLGFLTEFIYTNTEKKRLRAIDDMRLSCEIGINEGRDALKEFIHLYFNSKYARPGYTVFDEQKGIDMPYSLHEDVEGNTEFVEFENGLQDYSSLLRKYIEILFKDNSGSEIDNAKHLYGATLLLMRTYPDNAVLNLLKAYCIIYLGIDNNKNVEEELKQAFYTGFVSLYEHNSETGFSFKNLTDIYDWYLEQIRVASRDQQLVDTLTKDAFETISLIIHNDWLQSFRNKYNN